MFKNAARPDRARRQHIPADQVSCAAGLSQDLVPRVVHLAQVSLRADLSVDPRDHVKSQIAELVQGDQPRAERGGEVLSLGRAEADFRLTALHVPRGPVIHDGHPDDLPVGADDRGDLKLIVALGSASRKRDRVPRMGDGGRIGKVEAWPLIPLERNLFTAKSADVSRVRLESIKIANRRDRQHRRSQGNLSRIEARDISAACLDVRDRVDSIDLHDHVTLDPAAARLWRPRLLADRLRQRFGGQEEYKLHGQNPPAAAASFIWRRQPHCHDREGLPPKESPKHPSGY